MDAVKGRQERRKEVRHENKKKKNEAWLKHQQSRSKQAKRRTGESKSKNVTRSGKPVTLYVEEGRGRGKDISAGRIYNLEENDVPMTSKWKPEPVRHKESGAGLKRKPKTKFEEYLEMEMKDADRVAYEDLEMERKLAKKLKVKDRNVRGLDDGMDLLFEGFTSVLDEREKFNMKEFPPRGNENGLANKKSKKQEIQEEFSEDGDILGEASELEETLGPDVGQGKDSIETSSLKRHKRRKKPKKNQEDNMESDMANGISEPAETHNAEMAVQETLVKEPPLASSVKYVAPHLRSHARNESEEHTQIRRRVRGLLNRLSESNVESVTTEIANIFHSISRGFSTQIISEAVLASCSGGPRGNEQYAAVFAAFVAGMACSVGMDFSAKLVASLAKCFEDEYLKEDHLSLRNLTLLLSYLCVFEVVSSDLMYDFLTMLSKRLTDIDVSTILTVLQCCGMKIRGEDPTAMKNFIQSVQNRVIELKAGSGVGQTNINSKRMEFMLETICDIKNNKKRSKEETIQHTRIKKWLQKLRVEDILIRGIKWSKLLDPDKKGQWWLSGDRATTADNVAEVAHKIDKEVLEAQKMLQLAASQRMNTDARRAIFCIIMSGEDYIDAFEKLLRLDLSGKQDREIMRVLVECCLQEKLFNKYYTVLASKLCEHDKNHKFTLQYCLWDHFKELESMPLLRSMHLAKFVAEMVTSFTLSLAVLKTIEFSDLSQLTPKRAMHFRMLFEAIFDCPDKTVWNVFTRVAVAPDLETLRDGIEFFIREYVLTSNNSITKKLKVAKKALSNLEGVLM